MWHTVMSFCHQKGKICYVSYIVTDVIAECVWLTPLTEEKKPTCHTFQAELRFHTTTKARWTGWRLALTSKPGQQQFLPVLPMWALQYLRLTSSLTVFLSQGYKTELEPILFVRKVHCIQFITGSTLLLQLHE